MKKFFLSLFALGAFLVYSPSLLQASNDAPVKNTTSKVKISQTKKAKTDYLNKEHSESHAEEHHHAPHIDGKNLSMLWIIPFAGILLSIALFPLIMPYFWHHHYGKISLCWWALFFTAFTIYFGFDVSLFYLLEVYILEFIPFIALLLALFTVAGGIQLKGSLAGSPKVNTLMLLIGGLLASWMGTTGAAMVLIRPLLKANEWRRKRTHVVVFLIFIVANIGGGLTPLGDPPLFLGFLKGVSFFWTTKHMLLPMAFSVGMLLIIFFIVDTYYYKKEENKPDKEEEKEKLKIVGIPNIILIPAVVISVLASSFKLGTAFTIHYVEVPTASLLQVGMLLAITFLSMKITKSEIREANSFNWEPIKEVAKLFSTIFITMVPPIAMLKAGSEGPMGTIIKMVVDGNGDFINANFFWATGILSSFLDNAPTYVVFFNTAGGDPISLMSTHMNTLLAISAGAVFMGANTYIGNAPNFMCKSIAEEAGVPMPSFFGYMLKYSIPILIPTFIAVTFIFF